MRSQYTDNVIFYEVGEDDRTFIFFEIMFAQLLQLLEYQFDSGLPLALLDENRSDIVIKGECLNPATSTFFTFLVRNFVLRDVVD